MVRGRDGPTPSKRCVCVVGDGKGWMTTRPMIFADLLPTIYSDKAGSLLHIAGL